MLRAGDVEALVEAELHRLLQRIDHVLAGEQKDDDVRTRRLRLDQVGREIGGAERRQRSADLGAAELLEARLEALLQRVAKGIIGSDEVPLFAVFGGTGSWIPSWSPSVSCCRPERRSSDSRCQ